MPAISQPQLTPEQYLQNERVAEVRSEYVNGQVYAMAGASRSHNQLVFNLAGLLHAQLKGRDCEAFVSDMKLRSASTHSYFCPDLMATCDKPTFEDDDNAVLLNPTLIIEVLSDSTEAYDRGAKFSHYRHVDALQEYVLVAQDRYSVERYVRQNDGQWLLSEVTTPDGAIEFTSIQCTITLSELYDKVVFSQ